MKVLKIREAKARFSGVIAAAEKGRPTLITRHGQPSAMVVPVDKGRQLYSTGRPSFADYLLAIPARLPVARDKKALRDIDL